MLKLRFIFIILISFLMTCFIFFREDRDQAADDNRSGQLNPNNDTYWRDRGYDSRPDDWDDRR